MLTHGSLFTGYGGLDIAIENVFDAETIWVSDIDKGANKIIQARFPGIQNLGDITTVDWNEVPRVDIISGGSPCQDVSHAGKRAGMTEGTRSNLWVSMREAIEVIQPKYVVWENVRGAYSAKADSEVESCQGCVGDGSTKPLLRALGRVLGDLATLGYDAEWRGIRASDIGAPHQRFRVFVVANSRRIEPGITTSGQAAEGRTSSELGRRDRAPVKLLPTPLANDWQSGGPANKNRSGIPLRNIDYLLPTPIVFNMSNSETPQSWRERRADVFKRTNTKHGPPLSVVAQSVMDGNPLTRDKYSVDADQDDDRTVHNGLVWGKFAPAIARWENLIERQAPNPVRPDGRNGRNRLNPEFVEWMMGLPYGWVTATPETTRNEQLKALGNGVIPQQAQAAIDDCLRAFES